MVFQIVFCQSPKFLWKQCQGQIGNRQGNKMEVHFPFDQKQSFHLFYVMGLYKIVALRKQVCLFKNIENYRQTAISLYRWRNSFREYTCRPAVCCITLISPNPFNFIFLTSLNFMRSGAIFCLPLSLQVLTEYLALTRQYILLNKAIILQIKG